MTLYIVIRNMQINMKSLARCLPVSAAHCKDRSDLCIPRNETVRPRSNFHIHVSVSNLYISKADRS